MKFYTIAQSLLRRKINRLLPQNFLTNLSLFPEYVCYFHSVRQLKETEVMIKTEELPAAAINYLSTHYKGVKIAGASKVTKSKGEVNYEARLNKTDLVFNEEGKFIRTEKD